MGLYAGLPILTAPADRRRARARAAPAGRHLAARPRGRRRRVRARSRMRRSTTCARGRLAILVGGQRALPARRAGRPAAAAAVAPAAARPASGCTTSVGADAAHAELARIDPGAARAIHPQRPSPRRARPRAGAQRLEPAPATSTACGARSCACPTRVFALDWPPDELTRRIEARTRRDARRRRARRGAGDAARRARSIERRPARSTGWPTASRTSRAASRASSAASASSRRRAATPAASASGFVGSRTSTCSRARDGPERNAERILETLTRR